MAQWGAYSWGEVAWADDADLSPDTTTYLSLSLRLTQAVPETLFLGAAMSDTLRLEQTVSGLMTATLPLLQQVNDTLRLQQTITATLEKPD